MGKFRNYVFAAAGFVILAGVFTVFGPYVDLGHSKPPPSVSDVNVVNTPAEPIPVVVQNGGEPAGEKDIAIVGCSDIGFGSMTINRAASSFSGAPSLPSILSCAGVIAFYIAEGFTPSGEGSGGIDDQQGGFFFIFMTRNKLP